MTTLTHADVKTISEFDPSLKLVKLRIVVRSGSLSDPDYHPGLTAFTGRAILRGTLTRPYKDLNEAIERIGGNISVSTHASETIFSATVLAANFDEFGDILRDLFSQPAFDVGQLSVLQRIVQGELRTSLEDPAQLASRALQSSIYTGTPLQTSTEGTVASVSRISPPDVQKFFKTHYVRQNILVGTASPFPADQVAAKISSIFSALPEGTLDAPALPKASFRGRKTLIVDRKGLATTSTFISIPGSSDADPDARILDLANFVFGGDFTSVLMQELRAKNGWTYGVYSGFNQLLSPSQQPGVFSIYFYPTADYSAAVPGSIQAALSLLGDSAQGTGFAGAGITAEQFANARDALSKKYLFTQDTAEKRMASKVREQLSGRPTMTVQAYQDFLSSLTLAQVNASVRKHLLTQDLTMVAVGDGAELKSIFDRFSPGFASTIVDVQP